MFHQQLSDRKHKRLETSSPSKPPILFRFPLEIRLQIVSHLVRADSWKFCPHTRLPLLVSVPDFDIAGRYPVDPVVFFSHPPPRRNWSYRPSPPRIAHPRPTRCRSSNGLTLSVLRVNKQLYDEALSVLYSENIFYLEQYFSWLPHRTPFAWSEGPMLPVNLEKIPKKHLHLVRKIAFSVTDRCTLEPDFRLWRDFCYWAQEELPNLQHTYIFLSGPSKPSQVFLTRFPTLLDSIPGAKTIEFRGSNNRKRMIGNSLTEVFRHRKPDASTIRVLGGCYCQCWTESTNTSPNIRIHRDWTPNLNTLNCRDAFWAQPDSLWPWLSKWDPMKAANAIEGSLTPQFCVKHKGPMVGCLLCHKRTECVHDRRSKPRRIAPLEPAGIVSC